MSSIPRSLVSLAVLVVLVAATACGTTDPTNPEDTNGAVALSQTERAEVNELVGGSIAGWWRAVHGFGASPPLSVAAGETSSAWRNWGMYHAGLDPREPFEAVEDRFRDALGRTPWIEIYRTLVAARDALLAIEAAGGVDPTDPEIARAAAFAHFTQGIALGTLAQLFDEAWILDETVDPADLELEGHATVMAAALSRLDRSVELADNADFTVPAEWAAFDRDLDAAELARLARSFRARLRIAYARSPAQAAQLNWSAVLADARGGITQDWGGRHDGNWDTNWAWQVNQLVGSHPIWMRIDYRTLGPADASGGWQAWLATSPSQRQPFVIDTDDNRIAGDSPAGDGRYIAFHESVNFPAHRGTHRYSYYAHQRFTGLWDREGVGFYVQFPVMELRLIEAEALLELGDVSGAMEAVNSLRSSADLPAFDHPGASAPGGARCVPKRADGSCGDLSDALRHEKRLELLHLGSFTAWSDARRWGTLPPGTPTALLQPDLDPADVLAEIYAVDSTEEALALARASSGDRLVDKREAIGRYDRDRNVNPGNLGAG